MGMPTRTDHGIEYLYLLAGKSQLFFGRKDDLENLNMKNLHKAERITDGNFDNVLSKYLEDILERAKYFPKGDRQEYIAGRLKNRRRAGSDLLKGKIGQRRLWCRRVTCHTLTAWHIWLFRRP